mmetsp:Transcript_31420/g.53738  ORF Transcript_31420/g.53738 Transcript_31420/m.53738 type:complete len:124 (+) Transcript_31420:83-454(+)
MQFEGALYLAIGIRNLMITQFSQIASLPCVDINYQKNGHTVLYRSVTNNNQERITFLLNHQDIDVNIGESVLEVALTNENIHVAIELIKHGADFSRVDIDKVPVPIIDQIRNYLSQKKKSARK